MTKETWPSRCSICSAEFAKPDHLHRHQLSHTNERPYECHFCPRGFNRRDALLRHWRTCDKRLESGVPPPTLQPKKRGRRRIACMKCAESKKKCSGSLPCQTCTEQSQYCTYAGPLPNQDDNASVPMDDVDTAKDAGTYMTYSTEDHTHQSLPVWPTLSDLNPGPTNMIMEDMASFALQSIHPAIHFQTRDIPHRKSSTDPLMTGSEWFIPEPIPSSSLLAPKSTFPRMTLHFLANHTSGHGMAKSFQCYDTLTRRPILPELVLNQSDLPLASYQVSNSFQYWSTPSPTEACQPTIKQTPFALFNTGLSRSSLSEQVALVNQHVPTQEHPLRFKSREIVSGIRGAICSGSTSRIARIEWSESRECSCKQFFSPSNLELLLGTFFQVWYPNWPVFHKPTFDATQNSPQLIAALSLIGACLCSDANNHNQALVLMDAVEGWIFSDPEFCDDAIPQRSNEPQSIHIQIRKRLHIVLAAYALVLLMNWEGDKRQRTRARRTRFSEIVCVARSLYFFAAPQTGLNERFGTGTDNRFNEWMGFALREECIRTLLYIFLLDCAFVLFYSSVPRMVISELQFSLATAEECFLAPDPDIWVAYAQTASQSRIDLQGITLSEAISMMMSNEFGTKERILFEQTNLLSLFAIAISFHNLIFHRRNGPDPKSKSLPIERGLSNWFHIWTDRNVSLTNDDLPHPRSSAISERIGIYRHAGEYWCLALLFYNQFECGTNSPPEAQQIFERAHETTYMDELHKLIIRFQDVDLTEVLAS